MQASRLFAATALAAAFAAALSGCAGGSAIIAAPDYFATPPGVVYVAPDYAIPGPGYSWNFNANVNAWGWHHPDRGWHRGWR